MNKELQNWYKNRIGELSKACDFWQDLADKRKKQLDIATNTLQSIPCAETSEVLQKIESVKFK